MVVLPTAELAGWVLHQRAMPLPFMATREAIRGHRAPTQQGFPRYAQQYPRLLHYDASFIIKV